MLLKSCLKMEESGLDQDQARMAAEITQRISRHINSLNDPDRTTRKKGLEGIKKELFSQSHDQKVVFITYKENQLQPSLIKLISDPVEKCRELAIALIENYVDTTNDVETVLPAIVPCLIARLGQIELVEPSEELRLQLSELATRLVSLANKRNGLYLDDYIKILRELLIDPYSEVRKEACKCASILAKSVPEHFHLQSESLIKPLLHSISHQHSRVRVAVVNAIGKYRSNSNNL